MQSEQENQNQKRLNSIRSLPHGQFNKLREMFDPKSKTECEDVSRPTEITDLRQFEIEMDKIFEGVSDETNLLLSTICSKNRQIAEFFDNSVKPLKENFTELSISSFLSDSSSSSCDESKKANSTNNIYTEITSENDYAEIKSSCNSSFIKPKDRRTVQEPNETVITYAIDSDEMNVETLNSRDFSSTYSLSSCSPTQKTDQLFSTTLSTIEPKNYSEIHDVAFSDDSFTEDEVEKLISPKVEKNVQFVCPPPKPARTFEHDFYVEAKNTQNIRLEDKDHIYETLPFIKNSNENTRRRVSQDLFTKKIFGEKNKLGQQSKKFAVSEPNLTEIGVHKQIKNEKSRRTFAKFFNNIFKKSSSSRKNSQIFEEKKSNRRTSKQLNEAVVLREINKCRNFKNFVTKSYIYSDSVENKIKTLFDYVLIVGLGNRKHYSTDQLSSNEYISKTNPSILWRFPDDSTEINPAIPEFCFPDSMTFSEFNKSKSEIFQFTLTNIDGKRTYGYCIRLLRKSKNPIVICIISEIDALEMYYTILTEIDKLFSSNDLDSVKNFLKSLYPKPFPNRGESLLVTLGMSNKKEIILNRSIDRRLEHINLYTILSYPFDFIVKIFSSMLMEKKLIFLSNKLSSLSSTIQAFETLLYPFNWPHTYIPVLPTFLIEMTEAPTPYIIGLMRNCKNELIKYKNVSDILIIDLDKHKFVQDASNDDDFVPESLKKCLKIDLYNLSNMSKTMSNYEKNVELCKIFLKFFVKTVGNYNNFVIEDKNENGKFLYKQFINDAKTNEMKIFLENFTQSQLFEVFVTKKMQSGSNFGLMFDEAIKQEKNQVKTSPITSTKTQMKNFGKFYFKI